VSASVCGAVAYGFIGHVYVCVRVCVYAHSVTNTHSISNTYSVTNS